MPIFCVNRNAQADGKHEVHQTFPNPCIELPVVVDQVNLGSHHTCLGAVATAQTVYPQADGCAYCAPKCHKP